MFGPDSAAAVALAVLVGSAAGQLTDPPTLDRAPAAALLSQMERHGAPALVAALKHPSADVRRYAVWGLGQSPAGTSAVADLAPLLGDPAPAVRAEAADALANLGRAAEPALRAAMKGSDPLARAAALRAFGGGGARRGGIALRLDYTPRGLQPIDQPSFVGGDLTACLRDPDVTVRWAAIQYLNRVGLNRRLADVKGDALPGLRDMLFDTNAELRADADRFLAFQFGENANQMRQSRSEAAVNRLKLAQARLLTAGAGPASGFATVPAAGALVAANREALRAFAVHFQFQPNKPAKFEPAARLLDHAGAADPLTAHVVAYQLLGYSDDPRIGETLLTGLGHQDPGARAESATGLGRWHGPNRPAPKEVLAALRALAEDPTRQVRFAVLQTRLKLLPPGDERTRTAADRFRDDDAQIRTAAFQATPALGEAALPELEKAVRDRAPEVRYLGLMFHSATVQRWPWATPAHRARTVELIADALADPSFVVRAYAAVQPASLRGSDRARFGTHALPKALDERLFARLVEVARADPEKAIRTRAATSLGTFGARGAEALLPLLDDPVVRDHVATVVARSEEHGAKAVPVLRAMLKGTAPR